MQHAQHPQPAQHPTHPDLASASRAARSESHASAHTHPPPLTHTIALAHSNSPLQALHEGLGSGTPVTVKCRIGVDAVDDYASLCDFVGTVAAGSPVTHFIIHSRKCLLKGLNPAQNRTVPPLRYAWVYALRRDFPHLEFSLNGGIHTITEVNEILAHREAGADVRPLVLLPNPSCLLPPEPTFLPPEPTFLPPASCLLLRPLWLTAFVLAPSCLWRPVPTFLPPASHILS